MRFSNDGSSWEPWENYSTSKAWTLVAGTGLKTVWVEFIDNIGNTSSYEDSIFLTAGCDTIRIDNGAQYVWDRFDVPLTLNDCESGATDMRIKNEDGAWGDWESYSVTKTTNLVTDDGLKTVWVEFDTLGATSDTITLESTSPDGTISINSGAGFTKYSTVTLSLTSSDNLSGVKEMHFSNDSPASYGTWEPDETTKEWTLSAAEGRKYVYAQFRDYAGNQSTLSDNKDYIYLDQSGPTGSVSINSDSNHTNSTSVTLTLSASDPNIDGYPGSGVNQMRFKNDGGSWSSWQSYGTTKSWTMVSGSGYKTVWVQFSDNLGNISAYSDTINLDTSNPSGSFTINGGDSYTGSTTVTLNVAGTDSGSGVSEMRFKENSGGTWSDWETYADTSFEMSSNDEEKEIYAQFRDGAGNISTGDILDIITLDQSSPSGTISIDTGAEYSTDISANLVLSASDGQSMTMRFKNEDASWSNWESFSVSKLGHNLSVGEGTKTVTVEYMDSLGNAATFSDTIIVDTAAPTGSFIINGGEQYTNSTSVILSLSGEDSATSVNQVKRMNEGGSWTTWYTYASTKSWTLSS